VLITLDQSTTQKLKKQTFNSEAENLNRNQLKQENPIPFMIEIT
jgi:hypothetical protein